MFWPYIDIGRLICGVIMVYQGANQISIINHISILINTTHVLDYISSQVLYEYDNFQYLWIFAILFQVNSIKNYAAPYLSNPVLYSMLLETNPRNINKSTRVLNDSQSSCLPVAGSSKWVGRGDKSIKVMWWFSLTHDIYEVFFTFT